MSLDLMNVCKGIIPFEDFEKHVPKEWWKTLFNALYLKTDGDVVEDPEMTAHEIDMFSEILQLKKNQRILDLCCGQGRHSMELASRGFQQVQGLDQSAFLINVAKKRAAERGFNVKFIVGDARHVPFEDNSFDVVMCCGNSFGYSANQECDQLILQHVHRILPSGGLFFLDLTDGAFVRDNYNPRSWEWVDNSLFVCRERCLSKDRNALISREVITDPSKGVVADQFYSEKLFDVNSITQLLEAAGFTQVVIHDTIKSDSKRNQDLGMMESRMLVSCIKGPTV